jgi:hypothetical protein
MTLYDMIGAGGLSLVVLLTLIQIAPVKVDPWSKLAKWIGDALNGDVIKAVSSLSDNVDMNEIDRLRWEILDFANSCQRGHRHTREEFDHIIKMHEKYEKILKRRGESNGQVDLAYGYVVGVYKRCLMEGGFL